MKQEIPYARYDYAVQPREVDLTKRATIITLGDSILHTAGEDADRIGFGIRNLQSKDSTWVLSRMAVEIDRLPAAYLPSLDPGGGGAERAGQKTGGGCDGRRCRNAEGRPDACRHGWNA